MHYIGDNSRHMNRVKLVLTTEGFHMMSCITFKNMKIYQRKQKTPPMLEYSEMVASMGTSVISANAKRHLEYY